MWHFTDGLKLRDGQPLEVGKTYVFDGNPVMCRSGYHASREPVDALQYAPGFQVSVVKCEDITEEQDDKLVCKRRTVVATADARDTILLWAADVAEHAVRKYYTGTSKASMEAIEMVRRHVRGAATQEECRNAAYAADAADAAYAVAYAAYATYAAAYAAANRLLRIRLTALLSRGRR